MRALAGEPDFDRVIRFQPPFVTQSHTLTSGVLVRRVGVDGAEREDHPLVGAKVGLLGAPVFNGENGIVAEDGNEPIVPFVIRIDADRFVMERTHAPSTGYTTFPYAALQSTGIVFAPGQVSEATGVPSVAAHIEARVQKLRADLARETAAMRNEAIRRRLAFLATSAATRFFGAYMPYFVALGAMELRQTGRPSCLGSWISMENGASTFGWADGIQTLP